MRDYGKVHTGFWSSDTLRDCDADAKLLALYLLTSPHTHQAGVFRLPPAYACDDLGWDAERLDNGFGTLTNKGWLTRCKRTGWVWIRNFGKFNQPDNPNQRKAVDKQIALVPENCSFKAEVSGSLEPLSNGYSNPPSLSPVLSPVPAPASKARTKAKFPMPEDFGLSDRVRAWAAGKGFDRLEDHLDAFRTVAQARAYAYADWDAALMNAIRDDWAKIRVSQANGSAARRRVDL